MSVAACVLLLPSQIPQISCDGGGRRTADGKRWATAFVLQRVDVFPLDSLVKLIWCDPAIVIPLSFSLKCQRFMQGATMKNKRAMKQEGRRKRWPASAKRGEGERGTGEVEMD
ncbi:hypothetical protein K456DRAFT_57075 [Colletotrichum gloeosporioides 23]|nr:hypothetical protein K456DRAFT_57075 [Colletotrichum gloeosporioides 23]